jgi:hypothetical protein
MVEDAERDPTIASLVRSTCIAGVGRRLMLARRLAAGGLRVGRFEAGGLDPSPESQDVYRGKTVGEPTYHPLDGCRLRYLGGSSNHRGGRSRPLEAEDFAPKPHHPRAAGRSANPISTLTPTKPPPIPRAFAE